MCCYVHQFGCAGLILANAEKGSQERMGIAPNWWAFTALIGAFLFWNMYPRSSAFQPIARALKLLGLVVLVVMFAIFRRTTADGGTMWIDTSYWEILGLIGWAYLGACILYIPTRRWRWAPLGWFALLLALNVFANARRLKYLVSSACLFMAVQFRGFLSDRDGRRRNHANIFVS